MGRMPTGDGYRACFVDRGTAGSTMQGGSMMVGIGQPEGEAARRGDRPRSCPRMSRQPGEEAARPGKSAGLEAGREQAGS